MRWSAWVAGWNARPIVLAAIRRSRAARVARLQRIVQTKLTAWPAPGMRCTVMLAHRIMLGYDSFTIGGIFGDVSALLALASARKSNRDSATGSRDPRGLLLSGVQSRRGERVMCLDGRTGQNTGYPHPRMHAAPAYATGTGSSSAGSQVIQPARRVNAAPRGRRPSRSVTVPSPWGEL